MLPIVKDIIPNSIDELIDRWEKTDSETYRLTLLHKKDKAIYCFLSGNMQEIEPEQKVDLGMTIALSKRTAINVHYDVVFHRHDIDGGYYLSFDEDDPLESEGKIIPFCYKSELPSVIVDKNLKEKLLDYITIYSDNLMEGLEYFGEHNFLKAVFNMTFKKKWKEKSITYKEIGKSVKRSIEDLFREESSPSIFIRPASYEESDKNKKTIFVRQHILRYLPIIIPILAFSPYSALIDFYRENTKDPYENKFGQSKEEEARSLMSDFVLGHPKIFKGAQKLLELFKHASNMGIYAAQVAATVLAYKYTWPIISYPMILGSGLSGCTMIRNFIKSKGRNSSGIISTFLDYCYNELK